MIADRRLYLNAEKTEVLEHDDPAAAFLLAGAGCQVPKEYEHLVTADAAPALEPEPDPEPDPEPEQPPAAEKPEKPRSRAKG